MAFATKYKGEFTDNEGEDWTVEILEDGYGGDVNIMKLTGAPLIIDWPSENDDCFDQNIRGSGANIGVYCESDFQYSELFTSDNLEFKVYIYTGTGGGIIDRWHGWITSNVWNEPYSLIPYGITISATDGLGLLKDIDFADLSLTGRQTHAKIIYDVLGVIGFTAFTEYINVYESTMDSTTSDSPIDQAGADTALWDGLTLYDALTDILKMYNAAITQYNGEMVLYRYKELSDATMYGRAFTSATAKSATTKTPAQDIDRVTTASDFVEHGGTMMIAPQVKELAITQDYGTKESALETHDFPFDAFSGSWDVENWIKSSGTTIVPLSTLKGGYGEDKGIFITNADTAVNHNIYQERDYIVLTSENVVVSFEYAAYTEESLPTGSDYVYAQVQNYEPGGTIYYMTSSGSWTTTPTNILLGTHIATQYDITWRTKVIETTISQTGLMKVLLYAGVNTNGHYINAFRETLVLFVNSDGAIVQAAEYNVTNAVNGQIVKKEYHLGDGDNFDNPMIMERGAVNVYSGGDEVATSRSWSTRGGSEADPIIELVGGETGNQFSRPKHILDLELIEQNNAFLDIIGNLQDDLNQYSGSDRVFIINRATYDVKMRKWNLSLNELI